MPFIKYPQFSPNLHDIKVILPIHVLVILTKFHFNWAKIMDFYHWPVFSDRVIFFVTGSTSLEECVFAQALGIDMAWYR